MRYRKDDGEIMLVDDRRNGEERRDYINLLTWKMFDKLASIIGSALLLIPSSETW